jgi:DNA-binding PadR family transcriptional regulator
MAAKNKTRYAILGVLNLKPASGYDIKKFCDRTISHFWNENFGHILSCIKPVQKEGFKADNREAQEDGKYTAYPTKGRRSLWSGLLGLLNSSAAVGAAFEDILRS